MEFKPNFNAHIILCRIITNRILTCDMKMPGSFAPNGTHEWSVPPMMLNPSDPLFFGRMTSCNELTEKTTKINFR